MDDEPDVLETIVEVLEGCRVSTAANYDKGLELLSREKYDMVILDIMGVKGLHLLDVAVSRDVPSVMLTAPAFNPHYILESMQRGAISYFPKEDLANLDRLLAELFDIMERGASPWRHTMKRLAPLLYERCPPDWKRECRGLWGPEEEKNGDDSHNSQDYFDPEEEDS